MGVEYVEMCQTTHKRATKFRKCVSFNNALLEVPIKKGSNREVPVHFVLLAVYAPGLLGEFYRI